MDVANGIRPLVSLTDGRLAPALPATYDVNRPPQGSPDAGDRSVPILHFLDVLRRHRWRILSFVAASLAITAIVSLLITPVYESTATIDIDRHTPMAILGQESTQYLSSDIDQFLATQVRLIKSDAVLRPVVSTFHISERDRAPASADRRAEAAPVALRNLRVVRVPNTYLLLVSYRAPDGQRAADIANAVADSYIRHSYTLRYRSAVELSDFMTKQLDELKAKMERSSTALLQYERELKLIHPEERTSISSARLLQLNTEYTNAEADRVRKEAAFHSIQSGLLEAAQVSTQGEALKKLLERLSDAQEQFAQTKTQYGGNHPEYRRVAAEIAQLQSQVETARQNIARRVEIEFHEAAHRQEMLQDAVGRTKAELDSLNARSVNYQTLKREAEADRKLYEELSTKVKEAGINAGFQNNAIRLADPARPGLFPVSPNLPLNLALAFLCSTLVGVGGAALMDFMDNTIRDAKQASRLLKADVIGALPRVKTPHPRLALDGSYAAVLVNSPKSLLPPPSELTESFEASVRSLRNCILLGSMDRPLRSLLVTSAYPREGKSTIAASLAIAHAQRARRTLLVDCDLRRPSISALMGLDANAGLSRALLNGMNWRKEVVKVKGVPELDVLGAGPSSQQAIDRVSDNLGLVLDQAANDYDLVIVDSPPLLGFAESLQMAATAGGVLLVARAGGTGRDTLDTAIATLQRMRANLIGLVLNEVAPEKHHLYGYYKRYSA